MKRILTTAAILAALTAPAFAAGGVSGNKADRYDGVYLAYSTRPMPRVRPALTFAQEMNMTPAKTDAYNRARGAEIKAQKAWTKEQSSIQYGIQTQAYSAPGKVTQTYTVNGRDRP